MNQDVHRESGADLATNASQQAREAATPAPVPDGARAEGALGPAQAPMERAFGADFSGVRVHQDGTAEELGAQAFTRGDDIHFARGRFDPASRRGQALIGHELAHVVQQRDGRVAAPQGKAASVVADTGLEAEADVAGAAAARGEDIPRSARARGGSASGAAQAKADGAPIQCFDYKEHTAFGNDGGKGIVPDYHWDTKEERDTGVKAKPDQFQFVLKHGDIVALSGDLFDPRDVDENGKPIPDSLFRMASKPSSNPGKEPGTQDEIIFAIFDENPSDERFQNKPTRSGLGGIWASLGREAAFSEEVKKNVKSRFLRLASNNNEHFPQPDGPGTGGPKSGNRRSGGGTYRALHEDAILRAQQAAAEGRDVTDAMSREAAAQHFLTDAFSSGHIRTWQGMIDRHWRAKYPLFFDNFKKTIAHEVAMYINRDDDNAATVLGSVQDIMGSIYTQIEKETQDLPEFGFQELVSKIVHDEDNDKGLWVTNDLGMNWKTMGDGAATGETSDKIVEAVRMGCQEIQTAHALGKSSSPDKIFEAVRGQAPAPAKAGDEKYAAEQMMPRVDDAKEKSTSQWQFASFEDLWKQPVRTDDPSRTWGEVIKGKFQKGAVHDQLAGLASRFKPTQEVHEHGIYLGTVHPHAGYVHGFLEPIIAHPYEGIRRIIHYDPARGQSFNNTDDAVMEDFSRMDSKDKAAGKAKGTSAGGLTFEQRVSVVVPNVLPLKCASAAVEAGVRCHGLSGSLAAE